MVLRLFGKHGQRAYERGMRLYNQADWAQAIVAFDAALDELPHEGHPYTALARFYRAGARARLGAQLLLSGQYRSALEHLDAALVEQPGYPDLHFRKAAAHLRLDELDAAESAARKALRLNGQFSHARVLLALTLAARGDQDAAGDELHRARQLAEQRGQPLAQRLARLPALPTIEQVWPHLFEQQADAAEIEAATSLYAEGHLVECRHALQLLLRRLPDYADLRFKLALVHYQLAGLEPAREELTAAIDLNPRFADAWALLGAVHLQCGELAAARKAYETARREGLPSPFVDYGLAVCSLLEGDERECALLLQPVLTQADAPLRAAHLLACARALSGEPLAALDEMARAAELDPEPLVVLDALCIALEVGDTPRTRRFVELLDERQLDASDLALWLRAVAVAVGQEEAMVAAGRCSPPDAKPEALVLEIAHLEEVSGYPAAALRRLESFAQDHGDRRRVVLARARLLRRLGRPGEALALLDAMRDEAWHQPDEAMLNEMLSAARQSDDRERSAAVAAELLAVAPASLRTRARQIARWLAPLRPAHAPDAAADARSAPEPASTAGV